VTEPINAGASIEAVRRRLGHASTETTQIYTLLANKVADDEIRAARRHRDRGGRRLKDFPRECPRRPAAWSSGRAWE
jgi:integrase